MKIMFITPPYHCGVVEVAGRWVPLQFVYLAGAARAAGHECVIYDAMSKWHNHKQIVERIKAEKPDVVAMSVITPTYPDGLEVLQNAKKALPNVRTILGGVHAHFMYREILSEHYASVDVIIRGEGEVVLPELLAKFEKHEDVGDVKGIAYWDPVRGKVEQTQLPDWLPDLDALPLAHDLLDWTDYKYFVIPKSRLGAVSTSRGCMYGCSFCSQQKFWRRSWRGRNPDKVVEEIAYLKENFGVNVVLFTDEYPTADAARWERMLDLLIERDLGVYLLMETRVADILRDREILWKYRRSGIVHVYLGIEATDQETLDLIKKDADVAQSAEALRLLREHGMVTETSLVLGLPDDTPESVDRTIELSLHFNPDNAHFLAITPWPYANMYKELEPYIRDWDYRNYNLIEPVIAPKAMSIGAVNRAMVEGYRRFYTSKMKDFVAEKDPFRRHYLIAAAKLIMKSSFIRKKIKDGFVLPPEMKQKMRELSSRCPVHVEDDNEAEKVL